MAYQKIRIILLLTFTITNTTQQESCNLPGGTKTSKCVKLYLCDTFQNAIRQYSGRPPKDIIDNINSHKCPSGGKICCPDNAVDPPQIAPVDLDTSNLPSAPTDLNSIKNHRNFNLLNDKNCGKATADRIIGGKNAKLREVPWAVLLGYELLDDNIIHWQCGGTLISPKFVITASHCMTRGLSLVRLGEHQISETNDCDEDDVCNDPVQDIKIENKIKHKFYKKTGLKNDIGLLKLKSPADIKKNNVKTICLPINPGMDFDKSKNMAITGWGKLSNGVASDILQIAFVPFVENSECKTKFAPHNIPIFASHLCAGGHNKTDTCKGDSGGGITNIAVFDGLPRATLYGIVAGGIECLNQNYIFPGLYTDVRYYLDWILDNMS